MEGIYDSTTSKKKKGALTLLRDGFVVVVHGDHGGGAATITIATATLTGRDAHHAMHAHCPGAGRVNSAHPSVSALLPSRSRRGLTAPQPPVTAPHPHAPACCLYRQTRSGAARWRRSPRAGYKTHLPPCCWHTPFFFCFALVRAWRWRLAAAGTGCMRTTVTKNTVAGGIV